jgi:hypothetical protein
MVILRVKLEVIPVSRIPGKGVFRGTVALKAAFYRRAVFKHMGRRVVKGYLTGKNITGNHKKQDCYCSFFHHTSFYFKICSK